MLQHYQDQSCPEAAKLLEGDAVTYSVLIQILQGSCMDIYTDQENTVICYSCPPFPVWVWCRDMEKIEDIARCLKESFPLEKGFFWNLNAELLDRLREWDAYFCQAKPEMGLLSYRLDTINSIDHPCDGGMTLAGEEDIPFLTGVWHDMSMEMEGFDLSPQQCEEKVRNCVERKTLFTWRNDAGEIVALTAKVDNGPYSRITSVYTLPEHRRKGYAIHLVHKVTETILADGLVPTLYTDANYRASNACYRKIGYQEVGNLIKAGK